MRGGEQQDWCHPGVEWDPAPEDVEASQANPQRQKNMEKHKETQTDVEIDR